MYLKKGVRPNLWSGGSSAKWKSVNCMINSRELSQNLCRCWQKVEAIKTNFSGILDENTALKLENDKLREHLSQVVQEETGTKMSHGKVNLEVFTMMGSIFVQIFMANVVIIMSLRLLCRIVVRRLNMQVQKEF